MKRLVTLTLGLLINLYSLFSQSNPPKVYLELLNPGIREGLFIYSIKITNYDTVSYTIFKPSYDEICNQTIQFYFINKKTGKKFDFNGNCAAIHQLSGVPLNEQNSIYLNPNESFMRV